MTDPRTLADALTHGDRRALARAITLVESQRADHRADARLLLAALPRDRQALRLGITGTPGVGKSTFIEAFGLRLADQGLRLAVLAVDPSSARSGGSILGDKTRMERLTRHPNAFIRPSPSQAALGGLARRSREVVQLLEAAGHDVVLIETVGVGQSETVVADLCDVFLLLMAPAGGDELQGVKRGIMELADLIVVNKADGDLLPAAQRTASDYAGALRLLRRRSDDPPGFPKTCLVSALTGAGLDQTWADIGTLAAWRRAEGHWAARRTAQGLRWFHDELRQGLVGLLAEEPARAWVAEAAAEVARGTLRPEEAATLVVQRLRPAPAPAPAEIAPDARRNPHRPAG
jgi:LAO/AO transport system kinase